MERKHHVPSMAELPDVDFNLAGSLFPLAPKLFSTGSRGWYGSVKTLLLGWRVQVSLTVTIIGSKGKVEGEQLDTMAEKAPEAPLFDRADQNGPGPAKKPRKRS